MWWGWLVVGSGGTWWAVRFLDDDGDEVEAGSDFLILVDGECGGINPYTLTARLGPGDLAHHKTVRGLLQLLGDSHEETRRGDQAIF